MKKLLLHIGMGKTGTTAIQKSLRDLSMTSKEFHYPKLSADPSHNELLVLLKPHAMQPRIIQSRYPVDNDAYQAFVDKVSKVLKTSLNASNNLVLSAEFLWDLSSKRIKDLLAILNVEQFDEVQVLVYLREPIGFYQSYVQQRVKASVNFPQPSEFVIRYADILTRWRLQVGDRLTVKVYQREKLSDGNSVSDFLSHCEQFFDIKLPQGRLSETGGNESLTAAGLLCLYQVRQRYFQQVENRYNQDGKRLLQLIRDGQKILNLKHKPLIKRSHQLSVLSANQQELDSLKSLFDIDFSLPEAVTASKYPDKLRNLFELIVVTPDVMVEKKALDAFISANRFW